MKFRVCWDGKEYGSGYPTFHIEERPDNLPTIPDSEGRAASFSLTCRFRQDAEDLCEKKNREANRSLRVFLRS